MSMRLWMTLACVFGMLLGCGSGETTATGGAGGTGGVTVSGSTGGSSTVSSGGSTVSTGSGSTSTPTCDVPGPVPCAPFDPLDYPDPLLGYDPSASPGSLLTGLPGEIPGGAGAVWLGPWAEDVTVAGVVFEGFGSPAFALWTEATCGLPSESPSAHLVTLADDDTTLTTPLLVPAGQSLYVARMLFSSGDAVRTYDNPGKGAPRALWFGRVDNNCDGATDTQLGWAYLDTPTDPSVAPFPVDIALGVTLSQ